MTFVVNEILHHVEEDSSERILWIDGQAGSAVVIDIDDESDLPRVVALDALRAMVAEGKVVVAKDRKSRYVMEELIGEKEREVRDRGWDLIGPLVVQEPAIYIRAQRGPLLKHVLETHDTTKQTLYRLLRRYWQRGKTPNALLPDLHRCGAKGVPRKSSDKKRGRPRKHGDSTGINVTDDIRRIMNLAIRRSYNQSNQVSLADTYRYMVRTYFTDGLYKDAKGREQPLIRSANDIPTLVQLRYWHQKDFTHRQAIEARRDKAVYAKDFRAVLGSSTAEVFGPGSRYQIDATIADIYLVSKDNPDRIIGRPVLYFVVDVFSRMIAGFYAGLEGPSWTSAMMAIANAATDKVAFCRQFGIEIDEREWPSCHLPDAIIGDRGEMMCRAADNLVNNFGVRVENTPPYRADWKGIVEQHFRTQQAKFKPYAPGYVLPDFGQRGRPDYRLDAVLTLEDFTKQLIYIILHHNNYHELQHYDPDESVVAANIPLIPVELWKWGVENRTGRLKRYAEERVRLNLLVLEKASVTESGIYFKQSYYGCDTALREGWMERARRAGRWQIDVAYDPRSMDHIYLPLDNGEFEICHLLERSRASIGKDLWEIELAEGLRDKGKAQRAHMALEQRVGLDHQLEQIAEKAKERKAALGPTTLSDNQRVKNIRANRTLERDEIRKDEGLKPAMAATKADIIPLRPEAPVDNLEYRVDLQQLREKRAKQWESDQDEQDE